MIKINNLNVCYQHNIALSNISTTLDYGDLVAIVGPNGAGKSTLLKSIMQQITIKSGSIDLGDLSLNNIAYLPQSSQIDHSFPITVTEFVSAGAWQRTSFWRVFSRHEQRLLKQALAKVDLEGMAERQISQLSGGQFQRMLFARMLLQNADILLLDEPFGGIDAQTTELLMRVIQECQQQGKTIIAVIHDLALVQRYFPTTLLVATNLIAAGKTADVLTQQYLLQAGYQHFSHCAVHNSFNNPALNTANNNAADNTVTPAAINIENLAS
ncbi:metal ABC transporter ATP-binding protein [Moritella sp. F3]|uniref:metal ABC transporter ATP-binding protein n=1 Tax=Moritella sp. F3 TaxID=2718882 RepID=UPI0018E1244F|nr:metal ABC transporter ATP-binding protein [Moritella sp. F3]GIC78129.1 ABC transporter ATP-binding protein [Moritella sp. F1]GIC83666.1 ABC transporter ATP-binding protein [Moritella sp. F3]